MSKPASLLAAVVVALLGALVAFARFRDVGLLGFDTYPLILTARVESWQDFAGTFRERLMDGRYPGRFYRPVLNLSLALDHALWGLDAGGYQLQSSVVLAGMGLALFLLARRAAGAAARLGPWAVLVAFLAHPAWIEVVPVPARRGDLLCGLFLALSLATQAGSPGRRGFGAFVLTAVLSLAAMGAKETALVAPALGFAAGWIAGPLRPPSTSLSRAARASAPHVAAAAVALAARFLVLGGIGGHLASDPTHVRGGFGSLARAGLVLVAPQPVGRAACLVLAALAIVLLAVARPSGERPSRAEQVNTADGDRSEDGGRGVTHGAAVASHARTSGLAVLGLAWLVAVSLAHAAAGSFQPWYLLLPAAGYALLFGAASEAAIDIALPRHREPAGTRHGARGGGGGPERFSRRALAAASLLALTALLGLHAWLSPWVQSYPQWREATLASDEFLASLAERIARAPGGSRIEAPALPRWVRVVKDRPTVFGGAILTDYSIEAWAELRFPGRPVRVLRASAPGPAADEIVVAITALRPGFESP